jgi:hypothetical protein
VTLCKSDQHGQQHTVLKFVLQAGKLQQANIISNMADKAHSMLHVPVIEGIMTQILTLTITNLRRHCRRHILRRKVITEELCTVKADGKGCCRGRLHVILCKG